MNNPNELMPVAEVDQTLASRIGSTVRNGYEALRDKAFTTVAIGASALSMAYGAEAAFNPEPVAAVDPTLQQACKQEMLKFPKVIEKIPGTPYWGSAMANPGKYRQDVVVTIESDPVSPQCAEQFQLRGRGRAYLSYNKGHNNKREMYKYGALGYGNRGGRNQVNWANIVSIHDDDYKCGDSVWLELVSKVIDRQTHRSAAEKHQWHQLPVLNPDGSNAAC